MLSGNLVTLMLHEEGHTVAHSLVKHYYLGQLGPKEGYTVMSELLAGSIPQLAFSRHATLVIDCLYRGVPTTQRQALLAAAEGIPEDTTFAAALEDPETREARTPALRRRGLKVVAKAVHHGAIVSAFLVDLMAALRDDETFITDIVTEIMDSEIPTTKLLDTTEGANLLCSVAEHADQSQLTRLAVALSNHLVATLTSSKAQHAALAVIGRLDQATADERFLARLEAQLGEIVTDVAGERAVAYLVGKDVAVLTTAQQQTMTATGAAELTLDTTGLARATHAYLIARPDHLFSAHSVSNLHLAAWTALANAKLLEVVAPAAVGVFMDDDELYLQNRPHRHLQRMVRADPTGATAKEVISRLTDDSAPKMTVRRGAFVLSAAVDIAPDAALARLDTVGVKIDGDDDGAKTLAAAVDKARQAQVVATKPPIGKKTRKAKDPYADRRTPPGTPVRRSARIKKRLTPVPKENEDVDY